MRNPTTDTALDVLYQLIGECFPDNTTALITPAKARQGLGGLAQAINAANLRLDQLTTNQVFGSPFRVDNVVFVNGVPGIDIALIEPRRRILGMEIIAVNGTDATTASAGIRADPITFQLVAYPTGPINALINERPGTTQTVKARLVRTSGTDEQRQAGFELLELEDHPYLKGEVVKYVFPNGATRLLEWRANSVDFQHPLPTGRDDDPIYSPFALAASGLGAGSAPTLRAQCFTPAGLRTVGPFLFDTPLGPLSLKVFDNVASLSGQVNYRDPARPDIWNAGTIHSSTNGTPAALAALLATLSADMAAIPSAGLALGGELLLKVIPLDTSFSSSFLLDGIAAGVVVGRSAVYRQDYVGPPRGNLMTNPEFTDASGWGVTGSGADWAIGSGQAATVNGNAGNATLYRFLDMAMGTYRLTVGVLSLDLGSIKLDIQCPVGAAPVLNQFITSDGEQVFDFTVPDGRALFQFFSAREVILNHVYLVKLP